MKKDKTKTSIENNVIKYKIVVDAFGGDNAPLEISEGAIQDVQKKDYKKII